jgi:hypothetical protein
MVPGLPCLLLVLVAGRAEAGTGAEIGLIKQLLTTIFDRSDQPGGNPACPRRYKSDMASLQAVVELTTGDLKRSVGPVQGVRRSGGGTRWGGAWRTWSWCWAPGGRPR